MAAANDFPRQGSSADFQDISVPKRRSSAASSGHRSHAISYRRDIDGLRAIAVLAVVLWHAEVVGFSGGYVGVDIFFVISGFLITSILLREIETGTFSIAEFYRRRIRRILPALAVVVVVTMLAGVILMTPADLARLGFSSIAAALMVPNIAFWRGTGYFTADAHEVPLLHTWSLGVEEQFYLFFPLLLLLLSSFIWRLRREVIIGLFAASLVLSAVAVLVAPNAAFYLMPTRGWELLLGSLLALFAPQLAAQSKALLRFLLAVGLVLIAVAIFSFDKNTRFPGLAALVPTTGAALVILGGTAASWPQRLLSARAVVFIGAISYSLYLWHNPIFAFYRYHAMSPLTGMEQALLIGLSIAAAAACWRFVEEPFRRARAGFAAKRVFVLGAAATVVMTCFGAALHFSHGIPWRFNSEKRTLVAQNEQAADDWAYPADCGNYSLNSLAAVDRVRYCLPNIQPVTWSGDKPATNDIPIVLAWGDSNVEQLYPAFQELNSTNAIGRRQVVMVTYGGCPPLLNVNSRTPGFHCPQFNHAVLTRAVKSDVDAVILGASWAGWLLGWPNEGGDNNLCSSQGSCRKFNSAAEQHAFMRSAIHATLAPLVKANKTIVILLPFPTFDKAIAPYLARRIAFDRPLDPQLSHDGYANATGIARAMLLDAARAVGARVVDPVKVLCADGRCPIEESKIALYKDGNHLTTKAALALAAPLADAILGEGAGAPPSLLPVTHRGRATTGQQ